MTFNEAKDIVAAWNMDGWDKDSIHYSWDKNWDKNVVWNFYKDAMLIVGDKKSLKDTWREAHALYVESKSGIYD